MSNVDLQSVLTQMRVMAAKAQGLESVSETAVSGQTDFAALLKKSIDAVSSTQTEAGKLSEAFSAGNPAVDLVQVMVALQKASVSFQAMTQVRNKLVDAYQEVMRMNI